ncbi:MAG: ATP-binding protein [Nocardioides sp.]
MTVRTRRVLAALIGAAGIVAGVVSQSTADGALNLTAVGLMYAAYLLVGLLILRVHPDHLVGRLMLVGGAVAAVGSGLLEVSWSQLQDQPDDRWAQLGATLGATGRGFGWLLVVLLLPLVFPDGRRDGPPPVARTAWVLAWVCLADGVLVSLFGPTQTDLRLVGVDNPIGVPHAWAGVFEALQALLIPLALLTLVLAVGCLFSRWRHAGDLDRQRLLWFAMAFVLPIVVLVLSGIGGASPWLFALVSLPLPVAIGVACLQHRLYDLDLVLNRSLTYAALWLVIAALYALTVGGVGAMMRQQGAAWLPWVAAGVVAVSFAPLRDALQRGANRLTYGQWSQPAEVLAATGRRLVDASDIPALLQTLVEELGEGLHLTYVEIEDVDGLSLATYGTSAAVTDTISLVAYGVPVGDLRWGGRDLRETDRALLRDVAGQLGAVVHAAALLQTLRASQEQLVLAREEERRRLRRDLHDGLGPALAGLMLQVDTLRRRLGTHEAGSAVNEPLVRLRDGIQATVLDVRRIVEGLRPPALDELGLAEALSQLSRRLEVPDGPRVEVCAEVSARLPAAVEVAAYRIVGEGVTNAVHHAGAQRVSVSVQAVENRVVVEVRDDGAGAAAVRDGGVGLSSMRERAEEIGGSLVVDSPAGGGTTIRAELPLGAGVTQ